MKTAENATKIVKTSQTETKTQSTPIGYEIKTSLGLVKPKIILGQYIEAFGMDKGSADGVEGKIMAVGMTNEVCRG